MTFWTPQITFHNQLFCKSRDVAEAVTTRINWLKARSSSALSNYQSEVHTFVLPLINNCYESIDNLNKEMEQVVAHIKAAAIATLPSREVQRISLHATKTRHLSYCVIKVSLCGVSGAVLEDPNQAHCLRERKRLGVKSGSALDCVLLLMRGNALERENISSEWRMLGVSDHPTRKSQDARS